MTDYKSAELIDELTALRDKTRNMRETFQAAITFPLITAMHETLAAAGNRHAAVEAAEDIRCSRARIESAMHEQVRFLNYVIEAIENAEHALNKARGTSGSVTFQGR
jgi:hypothetical protein